MHIRGKFHTLFLSATVLASLGLTACSDPQVEAGTYRDLEAFSSVEEFPDEEETQTSKYQYLVPTVIESEGTKVDAYTLESGQFSRDDWNCSYMSGIQMELGLKSGINPKNAVQEALDGASSRMKDFKGVDGIKNGNIREADGMAVAVVNYYIKEKDKVYPCLCAVKAEPVGENGLILVTIIWVDNSRADDSTQDILAEVLSYAGLSFPEQQMQ